MMINIFNILKNNRKTIEIIIKTKLNNFFLPSGYRENNTSNIWKIKICKKNWKKFIIIDIK